MTAKLTGALRDAPATVPGIAAVALFVLWATDQAGYPVTHWGPGGLLLIVLLAIALACAPLRPAEIPVPVRVALGALAAYTALSYLSILWAGVPGDAWEGANRTLLYLLVFTLFAGWRQRGETALLLLSLWVLAMVVLAVHTGLHLDAASASDLRATITGGRLNYPSGYPNANAAQWLMAFWPAALLSRSRRLAFVLRGLLAGGAVVLAEIALLSQSRGSLYAMPVMLVLVFLLLPGRTRTFALLVPILAGVGAAAPAVLDVGDHLGANGEVVYATVHHAIAATFIAAGAVALVVAIGCALESRLSLSRASERRVGLTVRVLAVITLVAVIAGGLIASGDPIARIRHGWDTFKGGYAADNTTGSRLISGLGSSRYDFYRVALDELLAHPVVGIGADNFQEQYLVHGRSDETPHYPHSVEIRTLAETGLLGTLLALAGLAGALIASARALRSPDELARVVAAAALGGFAYWVVQGSFDWFWEFAGLGAPAFAMLGLACALAPGRAPLPAQAAAPAAATVEPVSASRRPAGVRLALVLGGVVVALAAALSLAAPWLQPARGRARGKHLDSGPPVGLRSTRGRRGPEPAQRRSRRSRRQHRPALRRTGPRRSGVLARAHPHARRRLRDARAGSDRLRPGAACGGPAAARADRQPGAPRTARPGGSAARAGGPSGQHPRTEPLNTRQSRATRLKVRG